jgi:colicin import membrane protein
MITDRPEEPGKKYALAFTILVHVGLIAVLFLGVQWKRSAPDVMEVELWSERPTPATYVPPPPPPPEPVAKPEPKPEPRPEPKVEPPPPKKPDIVIKEDKKKPEPKKPEPKPEPPKPEPKKPEPPKPEAKPQPKFDFSKELASETSQLKSRNSPSAQHLANAAAAESEQRASSNKRGLADYAAKIRGKVKGNIVLPPAIQGNPEAIFAVNQLPSGEVLDVKLKHSSGNPALDDAIERAIRKSSPLPKPDDPALFQRELTIKYKPFEE